MTDNDYGKILSDLHDKILNDEEMLKKVDHPELYALGMCTNIINRQKAEIERLKRQNERLEYAFVAECELSACPRKREIRGEAIKDVLNRTKKRIGDSHFQNYGLAIMEIMDVVKEMEGDESDA